MWTSLGIEIDTDASLAGADISRGSDRFVISEVDATYSADGHKPGQKTDFVLAYSTVPPSKGFPAEAVLDGMDSLKLSSAATTSKVYEVLGTKPVA